ncbi:MAG: DUF3012 domain-containing protein [Alphaproteobacteria bacterium]
MKNLFYLFAALPLVLLLAGCEPEVGSEDWCADIREKGAANVTASEAADFAKHCVL